MHVLTMTADEARLRQVVGTDTFLRAREYARTGAVLNPQWRERGNHVFGQVRGTARAPYNAIAIVGHTADGGLSSFRGSCTCPVGLNCKHSVALVLAVLPDAAGPDTAQWEQSLTGLLDPDEPPDDARRPGGIALQFDFGPGSLSTAAALRLGVRPVLAGKNGGWVRTGVSWSNLGYLGYSRRGIDAEHLRLLGEIQAMDPSTHYATAGHVIYLDALPSRRIWDILAEAAATGLPLVQAGKSGRAVDVCEHAADVVLDAARSDTGLALRPTVRVRDDVIPPERMTLLGEPAHGLAWTAAAGPGAATLHLARLGSPLSAPADATVRRLLAQRTLLIPRADEDRFFARYYPALRQRVRLTSADESVELPELLPPVLGVRVEDLAGQRLAVRWNWGYTAGTQARTADLWPRGTSELHRDRAHEVATLAEVAAITRDLAALYEPAGLGHRLASACTLEGIDVVRFATEVLPRLRDLDGVVVDVPGTSTSYREAQDAPVIEIDGATDPDDRDWFDLAVTVSVEGEQVPFERLFVALSVGESHLVLASGVYFSLDRPEFRALADLIAEARGLQEPGSTTVRLSRYQAGLWDELEALGIIGGQAADWQRAVRALSRVAELPMPAVPDSLHAQLRPYQHDGFAWLAYLYEHRLGGILADDMGLGKTLQTLALICHARQRGDTAGPFLVVAPTSVVSNWALECARFAPELAVEVVTETGRRRARPLTEMAAEADIVITSYTLFRLEFDAYSRESWSALVLDEAQFVKNHQSQAFQCVKRLAAPVKLAITGTPMENNLMELWSLLSITAPGLFPSPVAFEQQYRTPIERRHDEDALSQLRHRMRPFMLRRAKADVAKDLPAKQEQVVELILNPKHRRVYQTHLQRERQKVLGLLDDLDGNRFEIFRSLTLLRQACLDASLIDPSYAAIPSTKLDALLEQVTEIASEGHRTLVFSQFTRFLDAARARLDAAGIDYCYLDGKTRNRRSVLNEFKTGYAPVFLISLKAGGFGLNLTEADYCILLDPWWNPATEAQAVDRVHRIGQTKNVMVYRLVAKDTIEEKVMALKAAKAALVGSVLGSGEFSSGAITAADIRDLLS